MATHGARVIGLGVALLASAACREPAGPEPVLGNHHAVYAVIEVASVDVAVLAEQLRDVGGYEPLRGAQAMVSGGFGSLALLEASTTPPMCFVLDGPGPYLEEEGCYTGLLPRPAAAAEALGLEMLLVDGSQVRGAVVTPGFPLASIPPDSQSVTVPYDVSPDGLPIAIVPLVLETAPGAQRVDVVATVLQAYSAGGSALDMSLVRCAVSAATTPFRAPRLLGQHDMLFYGIQCREGDSSVSWVSLDVGVDVVAMEENYAGYMNQVLGSSSIDLARAGFGLSGAVGVFGAVATTTLPLRLTFVPD